jgi:N-acyl-L-homoserine lactone synthetase
MSVQEVYPDNFHGISVSPEIFNKNPDSIYWIGKVAMGNIIEKPEYYEGIAKFRAKVYVDDLKFLSKDHKDQFGREFDQDDIRSVQFAVVENETASNKNQARIVGSSRVIIKGDQTQPLPIEKYFPELFNNNPLDDTAVEISRFIARHEDKKVQHTISLALIRAMTHYTVNTKASADYCMIEVPLMKLLTSIGIPLTQLGEEKQIDEYGGSLFPVVISPYNVLDSVKTDKTGKIMLRKFFEVETINQGEGFYPATFTGGTL